MLTLFNTIRFRGQDLTSESSDQDLLTARGDQLHVILLAIGFFYAILFTAANFYFGNHLQGYLTIIPIPLTVILYFFFRLGGVWVLISKLGNIAALLSILSVLRLLDHQSATGILAYFIPVMVGSMITFQGRQRIYAWICVGFTMALLIFLSVTDIHLMELKPMSEAKLLQERVQNFVGAALVTVAQVGFLIWVSNQLQDRLLKEAQEKQRLATRLAIQSQEKQRNEVAIELHENINQVLASAKLNLDLIPLDADQKEKVNSSVDHIEYALLQIRKLYHTLVTPDLQEFELTELIRQMADELFSDEDIAIDFDLQLDGHRPVSDDVKLSLYRIAQEHLQNVRIHASASTLRIQLSDKTNSLRFCVNDNGVGFDPTEVRTGTGIRSMENRVRLHQGNFSLTAQPGKGCDLEVELPCKA